MIQYCTVRVHDTRVAAVLVEKRELSNSAGLIRLLEERLALPVMFVVMDPTALVGARAYAEFDASPYLYELFAAREIDWIELPNMCAIAE